MHGVFRSMLGVCDPSGVDMSMTWSAVSARTALVGSTPTSVLPGSTIWRMRSTLGSEPLPILPDHTGAQNTSTPCMGSKHEHGFTAALEHRDQNGPPRAL